MSADLRAAIVGAGFVGAIHARSARLAGARLVGVAASSPDRSTEAAHKLGAERGFATGEELVIAEDVDVVHLCAPNDLHVPLAEAALRAGKHVICEKPLALDSDGAARLVRVAAETGRAAAVPFVYRYYPMVREARERVRWEQTGPLRLVHGSYRQDWLSTAEDGNWRVDAKRGGASRAFADIGSHWCDLVEFVAGDRIARLSARTLTAIPARRSGPPRAAFAPGHGDGELRPVSTEDAAVVAFETERRALGTVLVSQVSPGRKNRLCFELDGAEETLMFDQEQPDQLWCGRRDSETILRRDPHALSPAAARLATLPAGHPQGYADCFDAFVADAYDAIRAGAPSAELPSFADGLRTARITDAVLASAREDGGWVEVEADEATKLSASADSPQAPGEGAAP